MRSDLLAEEKQRRVQRGLRWTMAALAAVTTMVIGAVLADGVLPGGLLQAAGRAVGLAPPTPATTSLFASAITAASATTASPAAKAIPATSDTATGDTASEDRPPAAAPGANASTSAAASQGAGLKTKPLSVWLGDVAREAGRDLVLAPEMRGDLTATETSRLDWQTRLEAYARVASFSFELSRGLIEVWKAEPLPRGFDERHTAANSEAPPPVAPLPLEPPLPETRVVRLVHAPAKETAAVLEKAARDLDVTATPDLSTNAVVLSGQPSSLARVQRVISELDRPRRRILLEAKIVEVARSARLDLGVEWRLTGTTVGGEVRLPPSLGDGAGAAMLIATGGASALDARISALESSGKLRVVSRPSVVMIEGSPATIESVRIMRIRLPSQGTVVGGEVASATNNGRATEDIPVGVRLEVTPAIRGGSRVLLRIRAKSSSLGAPLPPDNIPEELSRMVDAEVMVGDGETAVLGGLTRERGSKTGAGVPGLRRIPGLGLLFGKRSDVNEEEELLVLVTPRLLDGPTP